MAKKGDLCSVTTEHSSYSLTEGTSRYQRHCIATVASASRDGKVTRFNRGFYDEQVKFAGRVTIAIVERSRLAIAAHEIVAAQPCNDFSTLDEVRAVVRPYLVAAP